MKTSLTSALCIALACFPPSSGAFAKVPLPDQIPRTVRYEKETLAAAQCLAATADLKPGTWEQVREGHKHFHRSLVPVGTQIDEWRIGFYPGLREGLLPGTTKEDLAHIDTCMKDLDPPPMEPDDWIKKTGPDQ